MNSMCRVFKTHYASCSVSLGLLLIRLFVGVAFLFHGYGKILNPFGWMGAESGIPGILQALSAFAEFGGGILLILGFLTPFAALLLIANMATAVYMHASVWGDPFIAAAPGQGSYEQAATYLVIAIFLLLTGPGCISLDRLFFGERKCNIEKKG